MGLKSSWEERLKSSWEENHLERKEVLVQREFAVAWWRVLHVTGPSSDRDWAARMIFSESFVYSTHYSLARETYVSLREIPMLKDADTCE
jgi:hypothetical protein